VEGRELTVAGPTLADLVAAFVADEPGVEQVGPASWWFPFTMDGRTFSVFVTARDHQLLVHATRQHPVPAERLDLVHELIVDLNSELALAWFDCHRSNRVISARAALDCNGVEVTDVLIGNVVGAAVETMGRFLPAIDAVAAGEVEPADLRAQAEDPAEPVLDLDRAGDDEIRRWYAQGFGEA
jgi:Putative bacterial sensory transduction regulator